MMIYEKVKQVRGILGVLHAQESHVSCNRGREEISLAVH